MSAGGDGVARTWDLTTGQCVNSFQATAASDDYLHCIVARPKQRQFLAGSDHGMLSLWGTHTRVHVWLHRKKSKCCWFGIGSRPNIDIIVACMILVMISGVLNYLGGRLSSDLM